MSAMNHTLRKNSLLKKITSFTRFDFYDFHVKGFSVWKIYFLFSRKNKLIHIFLLPTTWTNFFSKSRRAYPFSTHKHLNYCCFTGFGSKFKFFIASSSPKWLKVGLCICEARMKFTEHPASKNFSNLTPWPRWTLTRALTRWSENPDFFVWPVYSNFANLTVAPQVLGSALQWHCTHSCHTVPTFTTLVLLFIYLFTWSSAG